MFARPLRAYLIVSSKAGIDTSVHRDLDTLTEAWKQHQNNNDVLALIHVGFSRLDTEKFTELDLNIYKGKVLLSESAKWALVSYCETSKSSISSIDGMPIYLALDGWGYTAAEPKTTKIDNEIKSTLTQTETFTDWIWGIENYDSQMADSLIESAIFGESSYLENEYKLPSRIRHKLGIYRYKKLSQIDDPTDPIAFSLHSPPWLLDLLISRLNLKLRTINALSSQQISLVKDFSKLSLIELLKIPNFGITSKLDLVDRMNFALQNGIGLDAYAPNLNDISFIPKETVESKNESFNNKEFSSLEVSPEQDLRTLKDCLIFELSKINPTDKEILTYRMGFETEPLTLEEIAQKFGITREGIRQLETRALRNISASQTWHVILENKLLELLKDREFPLFFGGLNEYDHWFDGMQEMLETFKYILSNKNLLDGRLSVIEVNGRFVVSRLSNADWESVVKKTTAMIKKAVGINITLIELKAQVEGSLTGWGTELRSELWTMVKKDAHFTSEALSSERRLVGYGRSIDSIVASIIEEADKPLHYDEITEIFAAKNSRKITRHQIHVAAINVGLLFARGQYGTLKHLHLTNDEINQISELAFELISTESSDRQWSTSELLNYVNKKIGNFNNQLNLFTLNICLKSRQDISYLGRNIWVAIDENGEINQSRIEISQAITSLLIKFNRPMTNKEIRTELEKDRGVSKNFQIHASGQLVSIGTGLWGLADRDIPLDEKEQQLLVQALLEGLESMQKGIPIDDLPAFLTNHPNLAEKTNGPDMIAAIAVKSGLIKRSTEDCLYLAEWGEDRLISKSEAFSHVLKINPEGLPIVDLVGKAEEFMGRNINRDSAYSVLASIGATFNHEIQLWQLIK